MVKEVEALALLRRAIGHTEATFREGQWAAIDAIVNRRKRVLCIQRTGWGKSMVYFVATRILRSAGSGPAIIVSPLLALMRNQIDAAKRLGLHAETINSTNAEDWADIKARILSDSVDLLIISPEKLANDDFVASTIQPIAGKVGLLVVDEAHCISDWGHDFRPDYRRIGRILGLLPQGLPVLATTATANQRVQDDVAAQLGETVIQRGALLRESLALQVISGLSASERLAWLAGAIPGFKGSGIVYALTKQDTERVAQWLRACAIEAHAYHADISSEEREDLEKRLLSNDLKCLVATTALGMGYDKPDIGFVVHYQVPGNVVSYYQQVGRAGRAISSAVGVLLTGEEDSRIHKYFRGSAFPHEWQVRAILRLLEGSEGGLKLNEIEGEVNLRHSQIEKVLKLLAAEDPAPVIKLDGRWVRTVHSFKLDHDRIEHLTRQRELEWEQMENYVQGNGCLMKFLSVALDDAMAADCGRCSVCAQEDIVSRDIDAPLLSSAQRFVRHSEFTVSLKKRWQSDWISSYAEQYGWSGGAIAQELRGRDARVLSRYGEPVWGEMVARGKAEGRFADELVKASAEMISQRWAGANEAAWVSCVPSRRHPHLVPDFARRLAEELSIPFLDGVEKIGDSDPQKSMENAAHQCSNLDGVFKVALPVEGVGILVDDVVDSAWTMTIVAALLRHAGATAVFPFALASSSAT